MKKHGSILEFTADRDNELRLAYRQAISQSQTLSLPDLLEKVVATPASRFWVSEERAYAVVTDLERGRPLPEKMRGPKQRMFMEIYRRFLLLRAERPDAPVRDLIEEVIYSPAPEQYMTAQHARFRLYKSRPRH